MKRQLSQVKLLHQQDQPFPRNTAKVSTVDALTLTFEYNMSPATTLVLLLDVHLTIVFTSA